MINPNKIKLRSRTLVACLLLIPQMPCLAQVEDELGEVIKVEYALIFPDEKAPEIVKPEEENPFVALADIGLKDQIGNSEENSVKERLLAMQVVGSSPRDQGYRVQLGDMILEPGMVVPHFLPDQSVQLRVNSITEEEIEFVWLEKQRTGLPPRTLVMPIKMKPMVRYALPGQSRKPDANDAPQMGVMSAPSSAVASEQAARYPTEPARGVVVEENSAAQASNPAKSKSAARPKSAADSVLDMFFNQGGAVPAAQ